MDKLQEAYLSDPETQQMLVELSLSSPNDKGFSLQDGIIRLHGKVWVGSNSLAQNHIMQALHASGLGGHSGIQATYHRIKALFTWPKMKDSITKFVQSCEICQKAKVEHVKYPGFFAAIASTRSGMESGQLRFH